MSDDWQAAWQPMVDAIGTDFGANMKSVAADMIELGAIRKYCEPLEMDCPLFYDEDVAKAQGYDRIPAPISGISQTWIATPLWSPGKDTIYPNIDRDFLPSMDRSAGADPMPAPPTTAGFATDVEIEYHRPAYAGDRLWSTGARLISVLPKETSVGKGAFTITESYVYNQDNELIATMRRGAYMYVPNARD